VDGCRGELQRWPGWQALLQLASGAALVVSEDMPVPPDSTWLSALAQQLPPGRGLWAVDAACVVPMQLVGKAYERAAGFRAATEGGRRRGPGGWLAGPAGWLDGWLERADAA
jgi:hypothetical protein